MNKPHIRFKGFDDEWQQAIMNDISTSYSGGTPRAGVKDYYCGNIPFIRSGEIHSDKTELFLTQRGFDESSAAMVSKGSILYALYGATSGEVDICKIHGAINQAILAITPNSGYVAEYLNYWLYVHKNQIVRTYLQGGQGNLSGAIVKSFIVDVPLEQEQRVIGNYFRQLDKMIVEVEREVNRLENMKRASLQKMFPRPDTTIPEIRFAGFSKSWETSNLGAIGTTYNGLSGKTKEDFGHGDARFVTYMNVFSNPIANPNQVEAVEIDEAQNTVKYGDILFTTSSETPEEVGMSSVWQHNTPNMYLNSFCFGFRPTQKINLNYLAYFLRSPFFRNNMIILAQGISRFNISKIKAMELPVLLPEMNEQKAIGEYFHNLDALISAKRHKLAKLRNIKQACLDKMFINTSEL